MLHTLHRQPRRSLRFTVNIIAACLVLMLSLTLSSHAQNSSVPGTITGRVFNSATSEYVKYAEIRVTGPQFDRTVVSDSDGSYSLYNVPAGEVTVSINYTGQYAPPAKITVAPGQTVTQNFNLTSTEIQRPSTKDEVIQLDKFSVSTEREGNAKAIMEQRASMTPKNVVASDIFGNVAEGNVGEFLKFMPGIDLDYVEADTRAVRIHGMDPKYASVTMDGNKMASAGSSAIGSARQFEFEQLSINNVASIEVNKTQTADMDADAVAGSINFKSKSALDRKGRYIKIQANATANSYEMVWQRTGGPLDHPTHKVRAGGLVEYSDSFLNNKLGIVATASLSDMYNEQYRITNSFDYAPTVANPSPVALTNITYKDGPKLTQRTAGSLNLDYKVIPGLIASARVSYSGYQNQVSNSQTQVRITRAVQTADSSETHMQVKTPGTAANIYMDGGALFKYGSTTTASGQLQYKSKRVKADAGISFSRATNHYAGLSKGTFRSATQVLNNSTWVADRSDADSTAWNFKQLSGLSWYDINNYRGSGNNVADQPKNSDDKQYAAQANVQWTPSTSIPLVIRAGVKSRQEIYNIVNYSYSWAYIGPTHAQASAILPQSSFWFSPQVGGNIMDNGRLPYPDRTAIASQYWAHPDYFTPAANNSTSASLTQQGYVRETINAAYVRADLKYNKWLMQAGLRYEGSSDIYKIYPTTSATAMKLKTGKFENDYDDLFFDASIKYLFTRNLMALVAFGQGLQRPDFGNMTGNATVNDDAMTFTLPNTELKPEYSTTYTAMVEYYFEPVGTLRGSVFMNTIKDKQYSGKNVDGTFLGYPGYTGTTTLNASKLSLLGFELEYSQDLAFLLKGLSVFSNYTHIVPVGDDSTVTTQSGSTTTTTVVTKMEMAGKLSHNVVSAGLSYNYKIFGASLRGVWTDSSYDSMGTQNSVAFTRFKDSRFLTDLGLSLRLGKGLLWTLNGRNIFNEPTRWTERTPSITSSSKRLWKYERYGVTWTTAVTYEF